MSVYEFQVTGSDRAEEKLRQWAKRIKSATDAAEPVHDRLLEWQRQVFKTEGGEIGETWPGYGGSEKTYAEAKSNLLTDTKSNWNSMPKLRWVPEQKEQAGSHEILYPSLTEKGDSNHVWKENNGNMIFGTSVAHAKDHQEGGVKRTINWNSKGGGAKFTVRVQMRKFMKLTDDIVDDILRLIRRQMGL